MSDSKPSVPAPDRPPLSNGKDGGNVDLAAEARFSNFAKSQIGLDSNALSEALRLFNETKHLLNTYSLAIGSRSPHEAERFWFAFVLYSSKRLDPKDEEEEDGIKRGSEDCEIWLSEILRASELTLLGFFKELPQFLVRADPVLRSMYGPDWEKRLKKVDSMCSPTKTVTSPLSPQSAAFTTEKWLRTVISPLPSKPSPELERFFVSCDKKDVIIDVTRRAQILLEAIFPSTALGDRCETVFLRRVGLMDKTWAEQRRLEALKLYFRVLEAMCRAEARTFPASNLTSLLTNERFHRCTIACSAELVLATHKTFTMPFPEGLERIGITAFDLSKVIESFVRHEDSLPRELRRHLNSLEERILESLVWQKGSSMYNSLTVARPALSAEIDRLGLLAEPMPSLDAIAQDINFSSSTDTSSAGDGDTRSPKRMRADYRSILVERNSFTSPKPKPPPLQSAFATPTRPNPGGGGETCAETGINVFFSKITKLAAVRINGMVERLQLSQQIREKVYLLFQQILGQRTALFFNRHIDQIILASLFGVATISRLSLKFSEIIDNYMKQPHCKSQVCYRVFVSSVSGPNGKSTQDRVHIFTFYNKVFIPAVKPLLAELGPSKMTNRVHEVNTNNNAKCPGSPEVSRFPSLPDMSPVKVSASQNVYVSPLRSSKMDALISHSSKSYYACVGESTHAYQSPSKDLSAINNRLNNNHRGSIKFNDANVEFVSDAMVAKTLCLQNGSAVKTEQQDS